MNQTENHNKVNENKNLNLDVLKNFENEETFDFEFKPINKGLGFHNEQKKVTQVLKTKEVPSPIVKKVKKLDRSHDSLSSFYNSGGIL